MIEINGRQFCENCFEKATGAVCSECGYDSSDNAPDPSMLVPGSVLLNRYVVGRVIGKGGFGITYLAYDALVGKKIAMKEYFPYGIAQRAIGSSVVSVASPDSAEAFKLGAEKFYNEAKLVSRFNGNPNIVAVYDCFYENATVYMAMEYLNGCTLKEYIREHGTLSAPQALFIAKNIAGALIVAHSASVLHRDISPDNIILCDNGNVKLIDFGAARQVVAEHSQSFSVILKPGFAPPEQYRKKGNQGPWTDVYSLGTTIYFTLTGDIPEDPSGRFDDDTFKENLFDVEPALWDIITKATKLNIEERYPDAYELKKALDRIDIKPEPLIAPNGSADAEPALGSYGDTAEMTISIKTTRPKKSFLRRHLRTMIEIACGLLVAAIIIPIAVRAYKPIAQDPSDSDGSSASSGNSESATVGSGLDLDKEGFNKPLNSCLSGDSKTLYSYIYDGLRLSKEDISIPSPVYSVSMVSDIFDDVLSDNPALNHTRGYTVNYIDANGNKEPDSDENVTSIVPVYTGAVPIEANELITKTFSETDLDENDPVGFLCYVHDKLLNETELVARNSTPTASTTHGVLVEHRADDMGLAMAMCDYAQRIGYFCFVADTNAADTMNMAIVRIRIDGKWYNINMLGGATMNVDNIFKMPLAEDGHISHTWFLNSDFYQNASGIFKYIRDYGETYASVFPTPDGMTISDGQQIIPMVNYYLQEYLNVNFYFNAYADGIYADLLEETKSLIEKGEDTTSVYILAGDADALWDIMQESYISDLKHKYDITISGFTMEFSGDQAFLTLQM